MDYLKKKKKLPLISFSEPISNPNNVVYINKKKLVSFKKFSRDKNRQDFRKNFLINGSIYIVNANNYIKNTNLLRKNSTAFLMGKEHSIQIDDYIDLKLVKNLI